MTDTVLGTLTSNVWCYMHRTLMLLWADEVKHVHDLYKPEQVQDREGLEQGLLFPTFSATSCEGSLE